jgi:hypothetical protein
MNSDAPEEQTEDSDYRFGILKLFFLEWDNKKQRKEVLGVVDLVSVKYTIAWVV